jgi:transaldolase
MQFFLDTADINDIKELATTGLIDGITTNPSLVKKTGGNFKEIVKDICKLIKGPVSAEVIATDYAGMMKEAEVLRRLADNVAIKVPLTFDGLKACRDLTSEGTMVNVTLCFSANQALLAAKAGATYVSPFIGRLDDYGQDGLQLIGDIIHIFDQYPHFYTQVLAASIRHPIHVHHCAKVGVDVATLPTKIFKQLYQHPLTDKGLDMFITDWKQTGQSIV